MRPTLYRKRLSVFPQRGFTLIELLVVVTVICVLIAVSLPVLSLARRDAKRVKCQSNLRQIGMAWQMYLNDYGGRFYKLINADLHYGGWRGTLDSLNVIPRPLNKYLDLPAIPESPDQVGPFRCPADGTGSGMAVYLPIGTSYQANVLLIGDPQKGWLPSKALLTEINKRIATVNQNGIHNPSQLLLIGDFGWDNCWEPALPYIGALHNQKCRHNLAFMDGHIAFLRIRKGCYITDQYTVLPFKGLYRLAQEVQNEEECD